MSPLETWRRLILDRLLHVVAVGLGISFTASLSDPRIRTGLGWVGALVFGFALITAVVLARWRRVDFRVRSLALLLVVVAPSLLAIRQVGFYFPAPFVALLSPPIFAALLFGRRHGLAVWACTIAIIIATGVAFARGVFAPVGVPDATRAGGWMRIAVVLGTVSLAIVFSVSHLLDRLLHQARANDDLVAALREKSRLLKEEESTRRQVEMRVTQSQKLEALGALAGGVAHDFNNLLTVVIASLDLVDEASAEDRRELLHEATEAAQRGAVLTRDLLAFSRKQVVVQCATSLAHAVSASLRLVRRLLPENIRVDVQAMDESLHVLMGSIELDQILLNLCVNARDAMPGGGVLAISVARSPAPPGFAHSDSSAAMLCVRDNGCGMDAVQRAKVFDPFFTTKSSGTGLGMSVVHGVVSQLSGVIEFDSELGRGTEFRVFLPLCASPSAEVESRSVASAARPARVKVLVVDDEQAIRTVMSRILRSAGYEVETCADGEEALHVLTARAPEFALVVTDAVMPNMGGRELHDRVAAANLDTCFLFCSGYASDSLESETLNRPGRDFIAKPFTAAAVLAKVEPLVAFALTHGGA